MLARFDRTIDTRWARADLLLIRLPREAVRGMPVDGALGRVQPASSMLMKLLRAYARTAWREAGRTGSLPPVADRHIAELVAAVCASGPDEAARRARPAMGQARVAAMQEVMRRDYPNPCLAMADVAAGVGLSERAGHLAFRDAGLCFTAELQAIRLDRARERLSAGDARVIDIAFATGFSDASHFHRLVKRRFGTTPADWRARPRP